ncbi:MAG: hypothetical protein ACI8Y4_002604 [Candidatus Poriferisodalaceae bacterium]|jgi:hypothetical protein
MLGLEALGYIEEEFLLGGTATRYRHADGTGPTYDGHWQAEPAGTAPFETRFIVYRPKNPQRFNGTVIVTWNNVTAGHDLFGADSAELFEGGYALVCLTTQKAGVEGLPPVKQGLASWDPERYGTLSIPGDDYSFDVLTQCARVVGAERSTQIDPLGGLDVRHVVAQGASQSAGRLATYINAIAPLTKAFDGYILTIYFGRGPLLEVGDEVVNINQRAEGTLTISQLKGEHLLRDDLGVPVFVVNSELEAIACHDVRQPDSDTFRYWEVAGTSHTSLQSRIARQMMIERDELVSRGIDDLMNAVSMGPVYDSAYRYMHHWLAGEPPPVMPLIEFAGDPAEIVRDDSGIAIGGIRLPKVEAPLATHSAIPLAEDIFSLLGGSSHPFDIDIVTARYGTRDRFLEEFASAANCAVEFGAIRQSDVEHMVEEARQAWPA